MKKTNKKNHVIVALIVLLLALALGYAAFSATLNINGTAKGTGKWDIRFKQDGRFLQADGTTVDESHNGSAVVSTTTNTNDTMTVKVDLKYPGDGVLLEAIVKNAGNIPAKLTGFTVTGTDDDFEVTGPTMDTGTEVIQPGGECKALFSIKWKTGSTIPDLGTKTFTITYNYAQETTEFVGSPSHNDIAPVTTP